MFRDKLQTSIINSVFVRPYQLEEYIFWWKNPRAHAFCLVSSQKKYMSYHKADLGGGFRNMRSQRYCVQLLFSPLFYIMSWQIEFALQHELICTWSPFD